MSWYLVYILPVPTLVYISYQQLMFACIGFTIKFLHQFLWCSDKIIFSWSSDWSHQQFENELWLDTIPIFHQKAINEHFYMVLVWLWIQRPTFKKKPQHWLTISNSRNNVVYYSMYGFIIKGNYESIMKVKWNQKHANSVSYS